MSTPFANPAPVAPERQFQIWNRWSPARLWLLLSSILLSSILPILKIVVVVVAVAIVDIISIHDSNNFDRWMSGNHFSILRRAQLRGLNLDALEAPTARPCPAQTTQILSRTSSIRRMTKRTGGNPPRGPRRISGGQTRERRATDGTKL